MKTTIVTLISILVFATSVMSSPPENVKELIKNEIKYPDFAKNQGIEGIVLVSFLVDSDGLINIELTNTNNEELKNFVVDKLKSLIFLNTAKTESKHNMKFVFKLS